MKKLHGLLVVAALLMAVLVMGGCDSAGAGAGPTALTPNQLIARIPLAADVLFPSATASSAAMGAQSAGIGALSDMDAEWPEDVEEILWRATLSDNIVRILQFAAANHTIRTGVNDLPELPSGILQDGDSILPAEVSFGTLTYTPLTNGAHIFWVMEYDVEEPNCDDEEDGEGQCEIFVEVSIKIKLDIELEFRSNSRLTAKVWMLIASESDDGEDSDIAYMEICQVNQTVIGEGGSEEEGYMERRLFSRTNGVLEAIEEVDQGDGGDQYFMTVMVTDAHTALARTEKDPEEAEEAGKIVVYEAGETDSPIATWTLSSIGEGPIIELHGGDYRVDDLDGTDVPDVKAALLDTADRLFGQLSGFTRPNPPDSLSID